MADKNSGNTHPEFGTYDRFLFDHSGEITRKAYLLDDRKIMIKLGNRSLEIDHIATRLDIKGETDPLDRTDFPVIRVFNGEIDAYGYTVSVEDQPGIHTKPAKFVFVNRFHNNNMLYYGGLSAYALDQNDNWRGIQLATFNAWAKWIDQITDYDKEMYKGLSHWVNRCRTSVTMRLSQSIPAILANARKNALTVIQDKPLPEAKEVKPEPVKETPKIIVTTPPIPVPLSGKLSEIEKITGDLVALG